MATETLFLGDLSILCTEDAIGEAFLARGFTPTGIKIVRSEDGRPRSFGFVRFATKDVAVDAMKELDGQTVYGRKLRIKFAARQLPDVTPITTAAPIHTVHVKFTTQLVAHFDGNARLYLLCHVLCPCALFLAASNLCPSPTGLLIPNRPIYRRHHQHHHVLTQRSCWRRFSVRTYLSPSSAHTVHRFTASPFVLLCFCFSRRRYGDCSCSIKSVKQVPPHVFP